MSSIRRKTQSSALLNLFRRDKDSSLRGSKGDKHDNSQNTTTVSPATSHNSSGRSADSNNTSEDSRALSFQASIDPQQSACPIEKPPTKQFTEQFIATTPSTSDTNLQITQTSSHNGDKSLSLPAKAKTQSSIGSRSYSEPAILSRSENKAENLANQSQEIIPREGTSDDHMKLWDEAYDELRRLEPGLVGAYEKILSHDYEVAREAERAQENHIEQDDWTRRRMQMDQILRNVLQHTTKPTGAEGRAKDAIDVVLSLKEVIGSSLQPVPIAALAWTGVCIGLQVINR
jgi:N-terminal domain of NWD NACHT-NTPase